MWGCRGDTGRSHGRERQESSPPFSFSLSLSGISVQMRQGEVDEVKQAQQVSGLSTVRPGAHIPQLRYSLTFPFSICCECYSITLEEEKHKTVGLSVILDLKGGFSPLEFNQTHFWPRQNSCALASQLLEVCLRSDPAFWHWPYIAPPNLLAGYRFHDALDTVEGPNARAAKHAQIIFEPPHVWL